VLSATLENVELHINRNRHKSKKARGKLSHISTIAEDVLNIVCSSFKKYIEKLEANETGFIYFLILTYLKKACHIWLHHCHTTIASQLVKHFS